MAPPSAQEFSFESLGAFDELALRTYIDPRDSAVTVAELWAACAAASPALVDRVRGALPNDALMHFDELLRSTIDHQRAMAAQASVVDKLFWPLVYWNRPQEYEELVSGERIHPDALAAIDLDGRTACDVGAGSGRFTLYAATRAEWVWAVDVSSPLLAILEAKARDAGFANVTARRGSFCALPVDGQSVDAVVACSSLVNEAGHTADRALREAERIARPGGEVAVIWPQDPHWFEARGFTHDVYPGNETRQFADVASAERLCERYYSAAAAEWVRVHQTAEVPYRVLGMKPPNDVCIKRVPG